MAATASLGVARVGGVRDGGGGRTGARSRVRESRGSRVRGRVREGEGQASWGASLCSTWERGDRQGGAGGEATAMAWCGSAPPVRHSEGGREEGLTVGPTVRFKSFLPFSVFFFFLVQQASVI